MRCGRLPSRSDVNMFKRIILICFNSMNLVEILAGCHNSIQQSRIHIQGDSSVNPPQLPRSPPRRGHHQGPPAPRLLCSELLSKSPQKVPRRSPADPWGSCFEFLFKMSPGMFARNSPEFFYVKNYCIRGSSQKNREVSSKFTWQNAFCNRVKPVKLCLAELNPR